MSYIFGIFIARKYFHPIIVMRRQLFYSLLIIVLFCGKAIGQSTSSEGAHSPLHPTLQTYVDSAKAHQKILFLYLNSNNCPHCLVMEETLEDEVVSGVLSKFFYFVKLNGRTNFDGIELVQSLGVEYYPASFIFNSKGVVKFSKVGWMTPEALLDAMRNLNYN